MLTKCTLILATHYLHTMVVKKMPKFTFCEGPRCKTCPMLRSATRFTSSTSGKLFRGEYYFAEGEPTELNCRSTNLIYLLTCKDCGLQYVGETVQSLRDRISQHRNSQFTDGSHCFFVKQHFSGSCNSSFDVGILGKLPGSGRKKIRQGKVYSFEIDSDVTTQRRSRETDLIRKFQTIHPYGMNIKLINVPEKATSNSVFELFESKRSSNRLTGDASIRNLLQTINEFLGSSYDYNLLRYIKSEMFELSESHLRDLRNLVDRLVSRSRAYEPEKLTVSNNFLILRDLFDYKLESFDLELTSAEGSGQLLEYAIPIPTNYTSLSYYKLRPVTATSPTKSAKRRRSNSSECSCDSESELEPSNKRAKYDSGSFSDKTRWTITTLFDYIYLPISVSWTFVREHFDFTSSIES